MQLQGALDKKKNWRESEQEERKQNRKALADLKLALRTAKMSRKTALERTRQVCREIRESLRARIKAMRERALEQLRNAVNAQKDAADNRRAAALVAAAEKQDIVERRKAEYEAEAQHQKTMRLIENNHVKRRRSHRHANYIERRAESDDEVRANLEPAYRALFDRVKRGIVGGPRVSRTEQFAKYVEEHPEELMAVLEQSADDKVEAMARERYGEPPTLRREPRGQRAPKYTQLQEVPF